MKYKNLVSAKKCEKPLDIVFVLDSSEKVGKDNWEKIINSTVDIASKFDFKYTRMGVMQYQSYPETTIKLIKFTDEKSVAATLKKIFYKSGGKRTDLALNSTLDMFKAASVRSGSKVFTGFVSLFKCISVSFHKPQVQTETLFHGNNKMNQIVRVL